MKAWYGIEGSYIDVTSILLILTRNGILDMTQILYNDVFGDPAFGKVKHLKIEHSSLIMPLVYKEDTPFTLDMNALIGRRYFMADLNTNLFAGLTNQLFALVSAVMLAKECGRDLVIRGFYPDYNKKNMIHLGKLLDLEKFNKYLERYDVKIYDARDFDEVVWNASPYGHIFASIAHPITEDNIRNFIHLLTLDKNIYSDIGYTFEIGILLRSPIQEMAEVHREICRNLPFSKELEELSSIEGEYHSVHLRLEDDMLDYMARTYPNTYVEEEYVQQTFDLYMEKIREKQGHILICTGLTKYPNKYSYLVDEIAKEFDVVSVPSIGRGREIDAAIDMIACIKSESFIGHELSTFSELIVNIMHEQDKRCDIIPLLLS